MFNYSFPACTSSIFLSGGSHTHTNSLHSLSCMPGSVHSGSANWDDCGWVFPDELQLNSFPDRFPTLCLGSGKVSKLRLRWVKGMGVFRCNLPPTLSAKWPGSFTCHCDNTGVDETPNKSHHTKLEENFHAAPVGDSNLQPFDHESGGLPTSYPGTPVFFVSIQLKPWYLSDAEWESSLCRHHPTPIHTVMHTSAMLPTMCHSGRYSRLVATLRDFSHGNYHVK